MTCVDSLRAEFAAHRFDCSTCFTSYRKTTVGWRRLCAFGRAILTRAATGDEQACLVMWRRDEPPRVV